MPDRLEHIRCAISILNIGGMNDRADQKTGGIGDDVAFAPLHLFTGVISSNPPIFIGFYALCIDNTGARGGRPALFFLACLDHQMMVDCLPQTIITPLVKPVAYSRWGRKIFRQYFPLATGRSDVENVSARPTTGLLLSLTNLGQCSDAMRRRGDVPGQQRFNVFGSDRLG